MQPGIYQLDADDYHADPAPAPSLSSTLARLLLNRSPKHAWTAHPKLNPNWQPVEKKTFDIGRAAHREVLGAGGDWAVIPPEILASNGAASTKEAKAFIEDCRARGVTPIKEVEADQVQMMAAIISTRLSDMGIKLDPARSEMAALAEIEGCWCRCMVDNAPADPREPLYDLKTTTDASPEAVIRTVMTYGYDVQAQHYREVWRAATGETRPFRFIFVEKEAPWEVAVVELHDEALIMGSKRTRRAREIWANCLRKGDWPGYPLDVLQVNLPDFYQARWLERESMEAEHKRATGQDILDRARRWQSPELMAGE